jgi:hypothetical protein
MGKAECSFLKADLAEKLDLVIRSIIIDRPSTKPIRIGDASSRRINSPCDGHPTHRQLTEVDLDYPTYSGKGTQYGKWTDKSHERIWLEDNSKGEMVLDESKIDWWATWQILVRLSDLCGTDRQVIQFIVHEKIFDLVIKHVTAVERLFLLKILNIDVNTNYNHHTHMHLKLDGDGI